MVEFLSARLLETEHLAALRIDARHHMANGAILACAIHALEDKQQRILVRGVVKVLQQGQPLHVLPQQLLIFLLRLCERIDNRRPFAEVDFLARRHTKILGADFYIHFVTHARLVACSRLFVGFMFLKFRMRFVPIPNGLNVLAA